MIPGGAGKMVGHLRLCTCVALLSWAAGCGQPMPGVLVGESAHFRLFVDPNFDLAPPPAYMQGADGLAALETDWADKQTMLGMPEGRKIDYHLLGVDHITSACGSEAELGCELADKMEIAASYLPYQHELMHAYMELLAPGALPIPFVVEGAAQSIGCGTKAGTNLTYNVPWADAVVEDASDSRADVYSEGGLFVRYLIRTQGIDAFVRYYRQAPGRRDPALFAANFTAFWNMSIDDVWAAMHIVAPGAATTDAPICPCSLPVPSTDGQPLDDNPANHPYWELPDTGGASLALTAASGQGFLFADCEGVGPYITSNLSTFQTTNPDAASLTDVALAIVQPPSDGRRRYVMAPISTASVGRYIADTCGGGVLYQLPQDFVTGWGELSIIVDQTSIGAVTKYVQVQVPTFGVANLGPDVDVCDSCAFGQGSCVSISTAGLPYSTVASGPVNVEWRVPAISPGAVFPD